jgi:AcrR family transcriptional regulator
MPSDVYAADDFTAKTRIRDAALALIAERGVARTSVRAIAERSGVSPGLVLHHFASKQGVFDEVASWVLAVLRTATQEVDVAATPADAHELRQAALDRLLERMPQLGGYLRQMLLEGSPEGVRWFRDAVRLTASDLQSREQAGMARRSSDVQAESTMLLILSMAPVLLRPFLEAALEVDLATDDGRLRWRRAQSELLTSALYPT